MSTKLFQEWIERNPANAYTTIVNTAVEFAEFYSELKSNRAININDYKGVEILSNYASSTSEPLYANQEVRIAFKNTEQWKDILTRSMADPKFTLSGSLHNGSNINVDIHFRYFESTSDSSFNNIAVFSIVSEPEFTMPQEEQSESSFSNAELAQLKRDHKKIQKLLSKQGEKLKCLK